MQYTVDNFIDDVGELYKENDMANVKRCVEERYGLAPGPPESFGTFAVLWAKKVLAWDSAAVCVPICGPQTDVTFNFRNEGTRLGKLLPHERQWIIKVRGYIMPKNDGDDYRDFLLHFLISHTAVQLKHPIVDEN